jgi:hypothetical protein
VQLRQRGRTVFERQVPLFGGLQVRIAGAPEPDVRLRVVLLAMSCASASPEPFIVMFTRVPVVRAWTVEIMLHHSACTEQITLTCPCAAASPVPARAGAETELQHCIVLVTKLHPRVLRASRWRREPVAPGPGTKLQFTEPLRTTTT